MKKFKNFVYKFKVNFRSFENLQENFRVILQKVCAILQSKIGKKWSKL